MRARIAIVSNDGRDGPPWLAALRDADYEVQWFRAEGELEERLPAWQPALVIYECQRPQRLGQGPFSRLRQLLEVPILVVLPQLGEQHVVKALKLGADGCLAERCGIPELLARVEAHLRRYWEWEFPKTRQTTPVQVDNDTYSVVVGDREVRLTPTEFRLLSYLLQNRGDVVSRGELFRHVWGAEPKEAESDAVSLYIHYLRKKLEANPRHPRLIRTKRGAGYYLAPNAGLGEM